ncbi:MAG: hypothetical protein AB7I19_04990 [Planctomycetota bacterium]
MIDVVALAAGFAADLGAAIENCGREEDLRDVLPFVELVGDGAAERIDAAVEFARGGTSTSTFASERTLGCYRVTALRAEAVAALARFDDLALPALYRAVALRHGETSVSPRLAGEIRGLVILCRCAIANGWQVLAIASDRSQAT